MPNDAPAKTPRRAKPQAVTLAFPESPFRLHEPYAAAGDQPEAIERLIEGVKRNNFV